MDGKLVLANVFLLDESLIFDAHFKFLHWVPSEEKLSVVDLCRVEAWFLACRPGVDDWVID